jgi:hypothetical protein
MPHFMDFNTCNLCVSLWFAYVLFLTLSPASLVAPRTAAFPVGVLPPRALVRGGPGQQVLRGQCEKRHFPSVSDGQSLSLFSPRHCCGQSAGSLYIRQAFRTASRVPRSVLWWVLTFLCFPGIMLLLVAHHATPRRRPESSRRTLEHGRAPSGVL